MQTETATATEGLAEDNQYKRLVARAAEEMGAQTFAAAVRTAEEAVALDPEQPHAHAVLADAHAASGAWLRACESALLAARHSKQDSKQWANCVCQAWFTRVQAASKSCDSGNVFCGCKSCGGFREWETNPDWIDIAATPKTLAGTASRVVKAHPEGAIGWVMQGRVLSQMEPSTASESFGRAAELLPQDDAHAELRAACLQDSQLCLEAFLRMSSEMMSADS